MQTFSATLDATKTRSNDCLEVMASIDTLNRRNGKTKPLRVSEPGMAISIQMKEGVINLGIEQLTGTTIKREDLYHELTLIMDYDTCDMVHNDLGKLYPRINHGDQIPFCDAMNYIFHVYMAYTR